MGGAEGGGERAFIPGGGAILATFLGLEIWIDPESVLGDATGGATGFGDEKGGGEVGLENEWEE